MPTGTVQNDNAHATAEYTIREDTCLSDEQREGLGNVALDHFAHYARHSTARTVLFFVKVFRNEVFLGLSPVIKTVKFKSTSLLKVPVRRWAGLLLGPLARKTTYMVDTALMGFQYASPFFCLDPADQLVVRNCVSDHLKAKKDVDHIWIAEPASDLTWAQQHGYDSFSTHPLVQVSVAGNRSIDDFLSSLSKKRRKNFRQDRKPFDQHGASIDYFSPPLPSQMTADMYQCLVKSAENNARQHDLVVPFEDLQIHRQAFTTQQQQALVARVGGNVIGFFSFFCDGDTVHQCHGGFDYDWSLKTKAYHNLMNSAIEFAIERDYKGITLGPLNNETKRRIGTDFLPVNAHIWCRESVVRLVTKLIFLKNFQVYQGPAVRQLNQHDVEG